MAPLLAGQSVSLALTPVVESEPGPLGLGAGGGRFGGVTHLGLLSNPSA